MRAKHTNNLRTAVVIRHEAREREQPNGELERLASAASHDLQESLRMVMMFLELLSKKYSHKFDADADRYIQYAVSGARRMQQLITDLRAYSRVRIKNLECRYVDCEEIIGEAQRNLRTVIEESKAGVQLEPLPYIWVDSGAFVQLFQHLLANAIKFRRKGEAPRIRISAVDRGADWVFTVRDNGIGIDPDHIDRIFQGFQHLHNRDEYPGSGMGLVLCKSVVERHGGRIWAESEPGAGSTFRFTVPKDAIAG